MKAWFRFVTIQKLHDSCMFFEKILFKVDLQIKTNQNKQFNKDTFQKKRKVSNKNLDVSLKNCL